MTTSHAGPAALFSTLVALAGCGSQVETGTGGHASTGTTSTSTTTSGTGGSLPAGGCGSDADCPAGSQCVPLTPGGYQVCTSFPPEATACMMPEGSTPDQCCTSADCSMGKCYSVADVPGFDCSGGGFQPYNECVADTCSSDADCAAPSICIPAGAFGSPARSCFAADCHTNADCIAQEGGLCEPIADPCCDVPYGLACVYAGGCSTSGDCNSASLEVCGIDAATGTGVCMPGPAPCGG